MPIAAANRASRVGKQPHQHLSKIQRRSRKLQSRKVARRIKQELAIGAITTRSPREKTQTAADLAEEWTPPASEPISAELLVAKQMMNNEIREER